MMTLHLVVNKQIVSRVTVQNITKDGLSNDKLNQYSVWIDGKDTGIIVDHWRDDGIMELCHRVFKEIRKIKI